MCLTDSLRSVPAGPPRDANRATRHNTTRHKPVPGDNEIRIRRIRIKRFLPLLRTGCPRRACRRSPPGCPCIGSSGKSERDGGGGGGEGGVEVRKRKKTHHRCSALPVGIRGLTPPEHVLIQTPRLLYRPQPPLKDRARARRTSTSGSSGQVRGCRVFQLSLVRLSPIQPCMCGTLLLLLLCLMVIRCKSISFFFMFNVQLTYPLGLAAAGNVQPVREAKVTVELTRDLGVLRLRGSGKNAWIHSQ